MTRLQHSIATRLASGLVILFCCRSASADYIAGGGEVLGIRRIADDGTYLYGWYPPPEVRHQFETFGQDFAVTPDLKTLYGFTNSLGYSNQIYAFDVATRAFLPDKTLVSGGVFGAPGPTSIFQARMAKIRTNDQYSLGDLFVISGADSREGTPTRIMRFDRDTSGFVEAIVGPNSQEMIDFDFGPDYKLYVAAQNGIYVYQEISLPAPLPAVGFELASATPLIPGGATGTIAFGPDGRLYFRNVVTGNVDRYLTSGQFVDTFIPAAQFDEYPPSSTPFVPGRGTIQFGVDGNLHVNIYKLHTGMRSDPVHSIGKFNGTTGELISTTSWFPPNFFGPLGRITYLPIPEPSTLWLGIVALGLLSRHLRCRDF